MIKENYSFFFLFQSIVSQKMDHFSSFLLLLIFKCKTWENHSFRSITEVLLLHLYPIFRGVSLIGSDGSFFFYMYLHVNLDE